MPTPYYAPISILLLAVSSLFPVASAISGPSTFAAPLITNAAASNHVLVLNLRGGGEAIMSADTASTCTAASSTALSLVGAVLDRIDTSLVAGSHVQGIAALFAVSFATVAETKRIR